MTGKTSYKDKTEVAGHTSLLVVNSSSFLSKINQGKAELGRRVEVGCEQT